MYLIRTKFWDITWCLFNYMTPGFSWPSRSHSLFKGIKSSISHSGCLTRYFWSANWSLIRRACTFWQDNTNTTVNQLCVIFWNASSLKSLTCKRTSLISCIWYSSWVGLLCSPIYAAFLILLQILSYSLIVYGYQLYNAVLSCLLLTAFNTHIRVMTNTLIWVLGHTFIWISSNNLYMVYHRLIVLMLYILLFITAATRHMCSTFVTLFILTAPD